MATTAGYVLQILKQEPIESAVAQYTTVQLLR